MRIDGDDSAQEEFNRLELAGELDEDVYTLPGDDRVTSVGGFLRPLQCKIEPALFITVCDICRLRQRQAGRSFEASKAEL